jgi:hypothetical protein
MLHPQRVVGPLQHSRDPLSIRRDTWAQVRAAFFTNRLLLSSSIDPHELSGAVDDFIGGEGGEYSRAGNRRLDIRSIHPHAWSNQRGCAGDAQSLEIGRDCSEPARASVDEVTRAHVPRPTRASMITCRAPESRAPSSIRASSAYTF